MQYNYPLDDGDLSLIEINNPSPIVQKLIYTIRQLRDELLVKEVELYEAKDPRGFCDCNYCAEKRAGCLP